MFGGGAAVKLLATGADDAGTSIVDLVKQVRLGGTDRRPAAAEQ